MNSKQFNAFCAALHATSYVCQWGGADVWKVGGKVFAIAGWGDRLTADITFKTTPLSYEILRQQPGLRPAPYLASRGMKWIQHYDKQGLSDPDLKYYLKESHRLAWLGLSKKKQQELGLNPDEQAQAPRRLCDGR